MSLDLWAYARIAEGYGFIEFEISNFQTISTVFRRSLIACRRPNTSTIVQDYILRTANLPTKIVDFGGFDSSIMLNLRGGIPRPIGNFPESLCQAMLVGCNVSRDIGRTANRNIASCSSRPNMFLLHSSTIPVCYLWFWACSNSSISITYDYYLLLLHYY